ncbi:C39 family peptidase [Methanosarcina barkeri]|uniref:Peptidase C39 family n=1 Tax=Methanosarcina barkeri CM1 TaxID=796385 RepID=A0A0G3CEH4_METBA|nr:C39 family peptidase [Methanosarcina barkeri]AKJ38343.1 peptidase C39 family [Methanosarcina barkeri CM1]
MKTRKFVDMSKLTLKALLSLGILAISLSSIAFAETNTSPISTNEQIPITLNIDQADEITTFYLEELSGTIPELSDWKDASTEPDITFYDLEVNITAYAFDVMKNNQYDGYIIASATKDKYPILEFSKGKLPSKISTMTKKSQLKVAKYASENKLSIEKSTPIYEGATFYYTEYNLQDSKNMVKKKVIVDLVTSKIISEDAENISAITGKVETVESDEIEEAWNDLENRMEGKSAGGKTVVITATSKAISNVPYYSANTAGCAPAAGAMVLGYWDTHGYPNIPSGNTLISELATAMGTYHGSTNPSTVDDGIETVCSNHGYTNFNAITYSGTMYMSNVVSEINANRPFVLGMYGAGTRVGGSTDYGDHGVTCMGYYYQGTTQYLKLHDGWDTSAPHYITYGNWDSAIPVWVRP